MGKGEMDRKNDKKREKVQERESQRYYNRGRARELFWWKTKDWLDKINSREGSH